MIPNAHCILSWLMHAQDSFLSILINLIKTVSSSSSSSLFIEFWHLLQVEFVEERQQQWVRSGLPEGRQHRLDSHRELLQSLHFLDAEDSLPPLAQHNWMGTILWCLYKFQHTNHGQSRGFIFHNTWIDKSLNAKIHI